MDKRADYLQCILEAYPGLELGSTELHTCAGQFNDVLIVNSELIFRFPRSPGAAKTLATETAILHSLRGRVTLPVPYPTYVNPDAPVDKPAFAGYRMIPGEPLWKETLAAIEDEGTLRRLATQLAVFLRQLHSVPFAELGLSLPMRDGPDNWAELYSSFQGDLFSYIRPDARDQVARDFEAFLGEPRHFAYPPVLRHGDFGGSNILYDPQTQAISGVIDFGSAGVGDPAVDLAAVSWYGDPFLERLYPTYPELASASMRERARFYRSTHALQQALWAVRAGDVEEFKDGIAAYV